MFDVRSYEMQYLFEFKGLDCPVCASHLEQQLAKIATFEQVTVNFVAGRIAVKSKASLPEVMQLLATAKGEYPNLEYEPFIMEAVC